jgi:hypothetical protein
MLMLLHEGYRGYTIELSRLVIYEYCLKSMTGAVPKHAPNPWWTAAQCQLVAALQEVCWWLQQEPLLATAVGELAASGNQHPKYLLALHAKCFRFMLTQYLETLEEVRSACSPSLTPTPSA